MCASGGQWFEFECGDSAYTDTLVCVIVRMWMCIIVRVEWLCGCVRRRVWIIVCVCVCVCWSVSGMMCVVCCVYVFVTVCVA